MEQYIETKEKRQRWLSRDADSDQVQAGSEILASFGEFTTIDALAGGDVTKYDEILDLDLITALTKLKYNMEQDIFSNRLYKIKEKRALAEAKSKR